MRASSDALRVLDSWSTSLSFLDEVVSAGLEPMVRRLDLAIKTHAAPTKGSLEPNGYAGISRRGDLGRILLSDWALADIEPDEFLRRVASAEVSYLELAREEPRPPGQIVVLIDSGPSQLGARRLAQLAGLVVLERRARAAGIPLGLGVLGAAAVAIEPPPLQTGPLPELFGNWLNSRTAVDPTQESLDLWLDSIDEDASVWVFGAPGLVLDSGPRPCLRLDAIESAWGPEGATFLHVRVGHRSVDLQLPAAATSKRLLRGQGLRRLASSRSGSRRAGHSGLRFPSFNGSGRKLLFRGADDREVAVASVAMQQNGDIGKVKLRRMPGRVVAASVFGNRTVALTEIGDRLRVVVIGKHLGRVHEIDIEASAVGLDRAEIDEICSSGLEPLFFQSGSLLLKLGDQWWEITPDSSVFKTAVVAAAFTSIVDQPNLARRRGASIEVLDPGELVDGGREVLLGAEGLFATEVPPGVWLVSRHFNTEVELDGEATVEGLAMVGGQAALVVRSPAGQLLRMVQPGGTSTLTGLSGDIRSVSIHHVVPLMAIERNNGVTDVVDLETLAIVAQIGTAGMDTSTAMATKP